MQKIMVGNERKSIALLHPKYDIMNPKMNVLIIAARELIDPIHDSCSFVSGPVLSGVFSDKSVGKTGDNQPFMLPWPRKIMFAVHQIQR